MKFFDKKTEKKIEELMDESSDYYDNGQIDESFKSLVKAYETIPELKKEYNESYNYCSYILDFILEEDYNIEKALEWLAKLGEISNYQKSWAGSYDFFSGKTYFKLKDFVKAKEEFDKSVKEGKGMRYFEDEDDIYKNFYLHPEKYIKD